MFVKAGATKKARATRGKGVSFLELTDALVRDAFVKALTVEDPVCGGGETNTLGSPLEGENLGAVDPSNGRPCEAVDTYEYIGACDDAVRGRGGSVGHGPCEVLVASESINFVAVTRHEGRDDEV